MIINTNKAIPGSYSERIKIIDALIIKEINTRRSLINIVDVREQYLQSNEKSDITGHCCYKCLRAIIGGQGTVQLNTREEELVSTIYMHEHHYT